VTGGVWVMQGSVRHSFQSSQIATTQHSRWTSRPNPHPIHLTNAAITHLHTIGSAMIESLRVIVDGSLFCVSSSRPTEFKSPTIVS
jgi:hypothetical protein